MTGENNKKLSVKLLTSKNTLLLHFFICSLGLMGLTKHLSFLIAQAFFSQHQSSLIVNDYLTSFFYNPGKKYELLYYATSVLMLSGYYILVYLILYKFESKKKSDIVSQSNKQIAFYLIIILIVNWILINPANTDGLLNFTIGLFTWSFVFLLPFFVKITEVLLKRISFLIFIFITVQIIHVFSPFIFQELKMMNEFLDIPEETLMREKSPITLPTLHAQHQHDTEREGSNYVNNIQFINEYRLFGVHNKYDIEKDAGLDPYPAANTYMYLPKTPALQKFLRDQDLNQGYKYYFNNRIQALTVIGKMKESERTALLKIAETKAQKQSINNIYRINSSIIGELEKSNSDSEQEFLSKNQFELFWQIFNRWVIHHHNFVLGPVNEYALGKDLRDVYMQYGWLNVVVIKNLLERFSHITYQNYFHVYYSFYYIYYGLFLILLFLLFKNINYVVLTAILSFSTVNAIGFNFLFVAPGLNPIRHFFDIFIMVFFLAFLNHKKRAYLYLSLLFAIIGILNNSQLGFFCLAALCMTIGIKYLLDHDLNIFKEILPSLFIGLLGLYLFMWGNLGKDVLSKYYLEGLGAFRFRLNNIVYIMTVFSVGYAFIPKIMQIKDNLKYIALFLFIYSQALLIYYIWGVTTHHFLNFAPIYILTFTLFLKLTLDNAPSIKQQQNTIIITMIALSLILYSFALKRYYTEKSEYENIFAVHKTFEWHFDTAQFESTMNPKYFQNSVDLINTYSDQKGIYIISKYDTILPFLSKRYSAMPYFDVSNFMVTKKEIQDCIDTIKESKPEYLFVDTDIDRNLNTDILNHRKWVYDHLHNESVWRVQRLNLLKDIFSAIRRDYQLVEKGYLIAVYKRAT